MKELIIYLLAFNSAFLPTPTPSPTMTPVPTSTPAPTNSPTPTPPPAISAELDGWFTKYSDEYHIDRQQLWNIAVCESGLHAKATNGDYGGLYQFAPSTWTTTRKLMNADEDSQLRFDPEEAIKTAAFKISTSGAGAWPSCH